MQQCKNIGCRHEVNPEVSKDFCVDCHTIIINPSRDTNNSRQFAQSEQITLADVSSGGDNDYWVAKICNPKRLEPYEAECEDIIEYFQMTFQEGEAFKALWRKGQMRIGNGKPGDSPLRNAQKVQHFGNRIVAMEERALEQGQ